MQTNLKAKLEDINVKDTHARATFQYDNHGVRASITKDTTVYELALLGIEIHKEIVRRCADSHMEATEAMDIVKGMTEIAMYDLMKEQLMKLLGDDAIDELLNK